MDRADRPTVAPTPDGEREESGGSTGATHTYLVTVLEAMSDGFVALDRDWRYVYVNARAGELLGRPPGTLEGKRLWSEFPEAAEQPFGRAVKRVMATRVPETIEEYYAPWGRWFENRIRSIPNGIAILFADVTERHASAEQLERTAHDFAALAEHAPDSVVRVSRDRVYLYVNPATSVMLGVPAEMLVGGRLGEIVPNTPVPTPWREALDRCFETAEPQATTFLLRVKGTAHWCESRFVPELDERGELVASVLVISRYVTARRRAEEGLERLAALVRSSEDAIVGMTLGGEITTWNPAAERMFGYSAAEAIGKPADMVIAPHARAEARALRERVARGERVVHPNLWHRHRDGREIPIAMTMAPVRDASGSVTGISTIKRDISEQQLLEAQLREAQKMEAVGRLAGGIAHDFNNLLTAILASAELALANPALAGAARSDSDELRGDLEEIRGAAVRAGELTKQLLAFSRRQVMQPQLLDVNEVIESAERLLRRAIGESTDMRLLLGHGVPRVVADRGQLEQVLLNLALNARDAMQERASGAVFTVETSLAVVPDYQPIGTALPLAPGRYAMIAARDTGVGMDAAVAARVFEPFFTTKEVGKGTGLGLAMVYGIVTQSGGHITAEGVPGVGSTFTIYLPAAEEADGSAPHPAVAGARREAPPLRDDPRTP